MTFATPTRTATSFYEWRFRSVEKKSPVCFLNFFGDYIIQTKIRRDNIYSSLAQVNMNTLVHKYVST